MTLLPYVDLVSLDVAIFPLPKFQWRAGVSLDIIRVARHKHVESPGGVVILFMKPFEILED